MDFYIKLYYGNGTVIKTVGIPPNGDYISYSMYRVVTDNESNVNYEQVTVNGTLYSLCAINLTGFYGKYYNLPSNHSDMEGSITGVVTGLVKSTLPLALGLNGSAYIHQFDWFDDFAYYNGSTYYRYDKLDPNISFSNTSFFPVNDNWTGDPQYFSAVWSSYIYANATRNYTYVQSSDDDSWTFIDGNLVVDLGGVHAATVQKGNISLTAGYHGLIIYFADRHSTPAGFNFTIQTGGITFVPFKTVCNYSYTTAIMEVTVWQKA
jgi:fibro-slime domain-containing protein